MIELCSDAHDEICFEGRKCPICELLDEMKTDHEAIIEKKDIIISDLHKRLHDYTL